MAAFLTRLARSNGRTLRRAALDYGLPVPLFHSWATGRALPSPLAVPRLAAALGLPEADLAARVAAERATRPSVPRAPRQRRQPAPGDAASVPADVAAAITADGALVKAYLAALADGTLDRAELIEMRQRAEVVRQRATDLVRDLDAAIESTAVEVAS